jgi:peptide-methionine (R)-S-oxide reductase
LKVKTGFPYALTEVEWQHQLTAEEFEILRKNGVERPFSGEYHNHYAEGTYQCKACNQTIFSSESKFDAGCGWPTFTAPNSENSIVTRRDYSNGMLRIEVVCANCGSHLGHVFSDGPEPTGKRFCINSICMKFSVL